MLKISQIGNSNYYFNVWYKVTNPDCLYKPKQNDKVMQDPFANMNNFMIAAAEAISNPKKNKPIGYYARQPFNSVKLFMVEDENEWECRMFLDTLEYGSECIAIFSSKEDLFDAVIKMLNEAKAIIDTVETQKEINKLLKESKELANQASVLSDLMIALFGAA